MKLPNISFFSRRSPMMRIIAFAGVMVPLAGMATNPPASDGGKGSGKGMSTSNGPASPNNNGDCAENECPPCDAAPNPNDCIKETLTFDIAPNEPGLGKGLVQLYLDKTDANLASRKFVEFYAVPQMAITDTRNLGGSEPFDWAELSIVQAGGERLTFDIHTEPGQTGGTAAVGKPMGSAAFSQARIIYVGSDGVFTNRRDASLVRQYRSTNGIIDYSLEGGQAVSYTTQQGRNYSFPLAGMEVIRTKEDGSLVVNGRYNDGQIRQIKTPAAFIDVVPLSERSYEIRRYAASQVGAQVDGLFTVNSEPSFSIKVEAPIDTQNELIITKKEGSYSTITHHIATLDGTTEIWTQNVVAGDFAYQRFLTNAPLPQLGPNYFGRNHGATLQSTPAGTTPIAGGYSLTRETYNYAPVRATESFSNGVEKERIRSFSQIEWDLNGVGKPTTQSTSTGTTISYSYDSDGRMLTRSFTYARPANGGGAAPNSKVEEYSYLPHVSGETLHASDFRPRTTTTTHDGVVTGKTYFSARMVAGAYVETKKTTTNPNAGYDDSTNLVHEKQWYGAGVNQGRLQQVRLEEGTLTRYEYNDLPNGGLETMIFGPLDLTGNAVTGHSYRVKETRDVRGLVIAATRAAWVDNAWMDYETIHQTYNVEGRLTQREREDLISSQRRIVLQKEWDGPLLTLQVDEEGVVTRFQYFAGSDIVKSKLREAVPAQGGFDAQPEILTTYSGSFTINEKQIPEWSERLATITAGGLTLTENHHFDEEGRIVSHTDQNGYLQTTAHTVDEQVTTETLPNGGIRITTRNSDGQILSVTGTGVIPQFFHDQPLTMGGFRETIYTGLDNGPRWESTDRDASGRITQRIKPSFANQTNAVTSYTYSDVFRKQPVAVIKSAEATEIYEYNTVGSPVRSGRTEDDGTLSLDSSTDRIIDEITTHEEDNEGIWLVSRKFVYNVSSDATAKALQTSRRKVSGFVGAEVSRNELIDVSNQTTIRVETLTGAIRQQHTTRPGIVGTEAAHFLGQRLMSRFEPGIVAPTLYGYDALGREVSQKNPRHLQAATNIYQNGTSLISTTTDAAGNTTSFTYHPQGVPGAGKIRTITHPDNSVTYRGYTSRDELQVTWGSQTYPTWEEYNDRGEKIALHTWQIAPVLDVDALPVNPPAGSAVTSWIYDEATGLLAAKRDADAKGADYFYDLARRLSQRLWARSVGGNRLATVYHYNGFGELVLTDYADSTPDVSITYDRIGRKVTQSNGLATSAFTYQAGNLRIEKETVSYDMNGDSIPELVRNLHRSDDAYLRPTGYQLKNGANIETETAYSYTAAGWLGAVSSQAGNFSYQYLDNSSLIETVTAPLHTVTNLWEANRDVLDFKENKSGTNVISSYDYTVNSLGQRTGVEQAGTAFASARAIQWGYDSLGQVTSADHADTAQSRYYAYDAIGNRNESRKGTATDSGGIITTYAANSLNQYTGITTTAGNPNINPVHDLDGNQTTGPLAVNHAKSVEYIWDAENRLIEAKVNGSTVGIYRYDAQGRRIYKSGSGGVRYFIYDDWNLIGEYNNGSLIRSHTWGTDLSGSSQGAGGVGGLLVSQIGGADYYPLYDGNGNVTEYRNASSTVAHFEYDAFGAVSSFTGPMWDFNLRFSTKYEDFETGLNYYGYRYYDPQLGRWLNRDPIEEKGGLCLYAFVANASSNSVDPLGLRSNSGPNKQRCECEKNGGQFISVADCDYGGDYNSCLEAKMGSGWSGTTGGVLGALAGAALPHSGIAGPVLGGAGVVAAAVNACSSFKCCMK